MADEAALIDAPTEDVAAIDTAVDIGAGEQVDSGADVGASGESGADAGAGESLRGSALWREVKTATKEGKPLTSQQLSALNKVIHKNDTFETKYPEGLSKLEQQMESVRRLATDENEPIEQVIENSYNDLAMFRRLDQLFSGAKPEFIDELVETSPEAFQNLAPSVFRKYAEMNPEGYSKYVSQAVVSHMNSAGVPMQFQVLEAFWPQVPDFPGKAQFQKALASVMDWTDALKGMASKEIAAKALPNQGEQPGTDLAAENANLKMENARQSWNSSVREEGVSFVMSEAAKAAGKTQLTDSERKSLLSKVGEELEARLTADRKYGEAMQGYLKAGNRSAYIQRIQSERKKLIPGAVRRAVADVIEARPKAAPKQAVPAVPGSGKKPAGAELTGAVQFRRIAGPPKSQGLVVDLNRTKNGMLLKRQAFVVGEKNPVSWGMAK